jgi:hypothetical protein
LILEVVELTGVEIGIECFAGCNVGYAAFIQYADSCEMDLFRAPFCDSSS